MGQSPADHLLPPNSSPDERTVAATTARITQVPAPIDLLKRPFETPAAFVPYLGWEDSVDVWSGSWPEARKRAVIDASLRLHMRKGTAYAIREYVRYVDCEVKSIERPPQKVFSGPALTREEREQWLSSLPQVRTWRMREPGYRGFALFTGAFCEVGFPIPSTALQRLRRRARWVVGGVETETRVTDYGGYFRLHREGKAGFATFCNAVGAFFLPSTAANRLVTVRPTARLAWRFPVGPTLEPVTAEPERITVSGRLDHGAFCNRLIGGYFRPSTAAYRIYWRFAVHDGRSVKRRSPAQFMNVGRYGFPAHTARLQVSSKRRRPAWEAGEGIHLPRTRFWLPHDPRPMQAARRAIVAAKRLSDQIFMRFPDRRIFVAGKQFIAGVDSIIVGRPT